MVEPEIRAYYQLGAERDRLTRGAGRLEFLRTWELLTRHLPPAPARILDVGGGAGRYAVPLAQEGYEVHLIDPIELHVDQAREAFLEANVQATASVGHARDLSSIGGTFDAVLLLGPLYHLTEASGRHRALTEARGRLREGGVIFAAAISRFASLCDGLRRSRLEDPEFRALVAQDLRDGQHRSPDETRPEWFTTAFFHRPEALPEELQSAGFANSSVFAVEGPGWFAPGLEHWMESPELTQVVLDYLRQVETEPSLVGASAHLLAIGYVRGRAS